MRRRFISMWVAAVLSTATAFTVHLALRLETIQLGYEVGDARAEQRRLFETRRLLSIEAATLRHAARVEAVAQGTLDMAVPAPERVIAVGMTQRTRVAGRAR